MSKNAIFVVFAALTLNFLPFSLFAAKFQSSSSVDQIREQIKRQPQGDIWWSVTGEDMGWSARNLHTLHPTVTVYRGGPVRELKYRLNPALANFPVDTPHGSMGFTEFLDSDQSRSMGVVVLHKGRIAFEHYSRMQPYEKPTWWSVSKSMVSAIVSILEYRGELDLDKPIENYIPEMSGSVYAGTLVRNILDMATGIDCSEEYYDRASCYNHMMQSFGETWWDETSPDNPYTYLATLKAGRFAEQGTSYEYGSVNTDLLAMIIEKITGMPFQDVLSKEIWTRVGMENDAAYLAPRFGVPHWDGGFLARPRDMARFGLLYTPSYTVVSDRRIIPEKHVNALLNGGRPELVENARWQGWNDRMTKPGDTLPPVYHWDMIYSNGDIYKGGWAGQGLLINPRRDLVAVFVGYFKDDEHSELAVLDRLRQALNAVYGQ